MEIQVSKKMIQENTGVYTPALLLYAFLEEHCKQTSAGYIVKRLDLSAAERELIWTHERVEQCRSALRAAGFLEKIDEKVEVLKPWESSKQSFKDSELACRFRVYGVEPVVSEDGIVSIISPQGASAGAISPYLTVETGLPDGDFTGFEVLTLAYLKDAIRSSSATDEYEYGNAIVDMRILPILFGSWCDSLESTCWRLSRLRRIYYYQAGRRPYEKSFSLFFSGDGGNPLYSNYDREMNVKITVGQLQYLLMQMTVIPTLEETNPHEYGTDYKSTKAVLMDALEEAADIEEAELFRRKQ